MRVGSEGGPSRPEQGGASDARRLLLVEDDRSLAAMLEEILGLRRLRRRPRPRRPGGPAPGAHPCVRRDRAGPWAAGDRGPRPARAAAGPRGHRSRARALGPGPPARPGGRPGRRGGGLPRQAVRHRRAAGEDPGAAAPARRPRRHAPRARRPAGRVRPQRGGSRRGAPVPLRARVRAAGRAGPPPRPGLQPVRARGRGVPRRRGGRGGRHLRALPAPQGRPRDDPYGARARLPARAERSS